MPFQSTRPAWGATAFINLRGKLQLISIHAPRVGRDSKKYSARLRSAISIHAPRVGRDSSSASGFVISKYFNPRAPRGARPARESCAKAMTDFNPRAPRGARLASQFCVAMREIFQSTRPAWGATLQRPPAPLCARISIHAPRVGRDQDRCLRTKRQQNFNPRAPRGARPIPPIRRA